MDYITNTAHYPGAFTDCEAAILRTVNRMGLWLVSSADLNLEQIRALLTLRNLGYIEYGAYGGYRVKDNHTRALGMVATPQSAPAIEKISLSPKVALVYYRDGRKVTHRDAARISELRSQVQGWHGERLGRHTDFVVYTRKVS